MYEKSFLYLYSIKEFTDRFLRLYDSWNIPQPLPILQETIDKRYRQKGYQYDENGKERKKFIPKYPNERLLISQLESIDELIVGGYHAMDCVKRVAEVALQSGINTLVDLELTDLFFNVYHQKDYFDAENYIPERFKAHMISRHGPKDIEQEEEIFLRNFSSPVYGFTNKSSKKL